MLQDYSGVIFPLALWLRMIPSQLHIVACWGLSVIYRRVLDWMIGFIDTLYIRLRTTRSYGAISDLHTSQFTVTQALCFSVLTSRILATDL
jgi:hypothetical protein